MAVFLAQNGFDKNEVLDMDHVSFTALHDEVLRMKAESAAQDLELTAIASQSDSSGIQKATDSLRRSAGLISNTKGIDALSARFGKIK